MTEKRQGQGPRKAGPRQRDDWLIENKPPGNALIEEFLQAYEMYGPGESWFLDLLPDVMKCFDRYVCHEVGMLDEAFQAARPPGYRQPAARNRQLKRGRVQKLGWMLRDAGAVTDKAFFEVLGEMTKVSASQAEKWFYDTHLKLQPRRFSELHPIFESYKGQLNWITP